MSEPELKLYDVHLIEQVRVKITRVPAGSAREALEKASRAPLGAVIDRDGIDIPLDQSVAPGAFAESVSFQEAAPVSAMVEAHASNGADQSHYSFDDSASDYLAEEALTRVFAQAQRALGEGERVDVADVPARTGYRSEA